MTPEGRVKNLVRKVLAEFEHIPGAISVHGAHGFVKILYSFWPVMNGMGSPSLDCLVCYYGHWIAIETKAPGKKPTPRQELTIEQMVAAGAIVYVISDEAGADGLRQGLKMLELLHANDRKSEASPSGRTSYT
jgi:hypothetical protein